VSGSLVDYVNSRIINQSKSTGQAEFPHGFLAASLQPHLRIRERVQKEAHMQRSIQVNRLPRIGIKATSLSADAPVSPPARVALQRRFKFEFSIHRNGSRRLDTGSS
jgi:hypothetical protein